MDKWGKRKLYKVGGQTKSLAVIWGGNPLNSFLVFTFFSINGHFCMFAGRKKGVGKAGEIRC